jgi:hypothetical protein
MPNSVPDIPTPFLIELSQRHNVAPTKGKSMTNIIPWGSGSNSPAVPEGFNRSEGKQLQASTNREVAAGIVKNTRLSVAQFLTGTAMQHTAGLAKHAYALADGDEYLASRLSALVDGYVLYAKDEIASLRRLG